MMALARGGSNPSVAVKCSARGSGLPGSCTYNSALRRAALVKSRNKRPRRRHETQPTHAQDDGFLRSPLQRTERPRKLLREFERVEVSLLAKALTT